MNDQPILSSSLPLSVCVQTGIDELLLTRLPSFFLCNLFLDLRYLEVCQLVALSYGKFQHSVRTVSLGSASIVNFCCFRSWNEDQFSARKNR